MLRQTLCPAVASLVVLSLLVWCRPALALNPAVVDGADLFRPQSVERADVLVRQIKRTFGKDVMIETYTGIPDDLKADFQKMGKDAFYARWTESRAKALKPTGMFILITKDPGRLEVNVGKVTQQKVFTIADRDELRQTMVRFFQQKQFDEGLLAGLDFIRQRMARNTGVPVEVVDNPPNPAHPNPGTPPAGAGGTGGAPAPTTAAPSTNPATAPAVPATSPATAPAPLPVPAPAPPSTQTESDF